MSVEYRTIFDRCSADMKTSSAPPDGGKNWETPGEHWPHSADFPKSSRQCYFEIAIFPNQGNFLDGHATQEERRQAEEG